MLILSVELENIKCHERALFEFMPGTNAISGPNGAGKSSILEAIGYALFDFSTYSKGDFVRRGASTGTVRVTIESSVDEREYVVVRNTKTMYYVYDPATKTRVAEQKADVLAWLCEHMGLDPGTNLGEFFQTTIGVPQGTFTAVFLDTATRRKQVFDRILKVEEYRAAFEALKETANHLQAKIHEAERSLAGLEGQLLRLSDLEVQEAQLETERQSTQERLDRSRKELEAWQTRLAECEELAKAIARDQAEATRLDAALEIARREAEAAAQRLAEAESARTESETLAPEVAAHEEATGTLAALAKEREERDALRAEESKLQRRIDEAKARMNVLDERLAQLAKDAGERETLAPKVQEQEAHEAVVAASKSALQEAVAAEERLKAQQAEAARWAQRMQELEAQLKTLDALADAPQRLSEAEGAVTAARKGLRDWQEAELAHREIDRERDRHQRDRQDKDKEREGYARKLAESAPLVALAGELTALTEQGQQAGGEVAALEAEIERMRKASGQFQGNLCPILNTDCPILDGQSPEEYYRKAIAETERSLEEKRNRLAELRRRWKDANDASKKVAAAETWQAEHAKLEAALAGLASEEKALIERKAALPELKGERAQRETVVEAAEKAQKAAQDDASRWGQRPGIASQLADLRADLERRAAANQADAELASTREVRAAALQTAERALTTLGDPRARSRALEVALGDRPRLEGERAEQATASAAASQELARLAERLAPSQDLDARWKAADDRRLATEPAHRRHLALAAVVAEHPTRLEAHARATEGLARAMEAREAHRQEATERAGRYRSDEHEGLRERVEGLKAETIRLEQGLGFVTQKLAGVREDIATMRRLQGELKEQIAARDRLARQAAFLEFARDTLKEAGPHVTQAYMASVSLEADRLFREITGLDHLHLRWTADYEIVLEEDGRDRSFANLSGGEQMAAAVAVRLALLKEISAIDVAFFDEPTTNMDEARRASLAHQIGHLTSFRQLFVISHDDAFEQWTDHVVRVGTPLGV